MNLATPYLGLELRNPLIASSSSQNGEIDHLRRLDDAGIGAVVLPSVFQEQLEAQQSDFESLLAQQGWAPDYLTVRQRHDLQPPAADAAAGTLVALGAARLGSTRLIDNLEF